MVESEQDGPSMLTSDDPSAMEAELWRHLREGVMPGRLDERLLLALWRSLHSFVHWHDDPRDAADRRLAGSWFGMLLSAVDRKNADLVSDRHNPATWGSAYSGHPVARQADA